MSEELGRYTLLEEIGKGGFAVVYRARDTTLERNVAFKELHQGLLNDGDWVKRFLSEARTIARLHHPHIVSIYDVLDVEDRLFIVMHLVDGPSLDKVIAGQGRLAWSQSLEIIRTIAEALDYAHGQGVLHRDLKPANILLDPERGAQLTDFGLAKLAGEAGSSVTAAGKIVGTPQYIAPEVWEGQGTTPQSDIYALGCILYEMVTGQPLFGGASPPVVMMAHFNPVTLPHRWPEGVPVGLVDVLMTALAKQPGTRYATAAEMVAALAELTSDEALPPSKRVSQAMKRGAPKTETGKRGRLALYSFGSPEVRLDDKPVSLNHRKALALLIYLAVTGDPHQRERLATLFWPENRPDRGRANLRQVLWVLKQALGEGWLQTEAEEISLSQGADIWTDMAKFKALLADGQAHKGPPVPGLAAVEPLEQAVALYRGDFLAGFTLPDSPAFDEWQFFAAETARQQMFAGLEALVEHYLAAKAYEPAIRHARRWLELDPLHEPTHRTLMRLYALSGRQAAALRQFGECQRILHDELDLEPDAETLALATAIREKRLVPPAAEEIDHPGGKTALAGPPALAYREDEAELLQRALLQPRPLFVGREPQLAQLEQALELALSGQGQLRLITGEAGAGKSALVAEFIHRVATDQADLLVTLGACDAQTSSLDPYLPFREALARLTGSRQISSANLTLPGHLAEPAQRLREIASRALLEYGPQLLPIFVPASDAQTVITNAQRAGWQGEPPPAGEGENVDQSRIFEQVVAVLRGLAAQMALILVLEDLHWADSGSLGLLFRLARQLADSPILVIGTYRVEAVRTDRQGEGHPLAKMVLEVQRSLGDIYIDLEAARATEGQTLVDGLLDTEPNRLDASFRQALHRQTGGHPLFVVELLQDLKETQALVADQEGRWIVGTGLDWQNLPARVEGAIAGRMAQLTEAQRWPLTIASVVGERFPLEVVAHVAGTEPRQLAQILSHVLQAQHRLVEAEGVERLGERRLTRYRFRHNLMQLYLYEQLDEVQRIYLHEDVARALEALYGAEAETMALPLAHHYQAAGVGQKAVDYWMLAGEQAVRLAANEEAVQHFTQALDLLAALPENIERDRQELILQSNLGQALLISKGYSAPEVEGAYTRALELGRQLGETGQIIQALFGLVQHALFRSELALAQAYGEEYLRLAAESQEPALLVAANRILNRIASQLGQHAEAVAYGEQVIAFYRTHQATLTFDEVQSLAFTLSTMGLNLTPLGYPDRALRQAHEALALVQSQAHHFGTVYCLGILAFIHLLRGEWHAALQHAEEAVAGANTHNFTQLRAFAQMHQGVALTRLGGAEVGIGLVHQAIAEREAMGITFGHQSTTLARLAEACGSAGRVAEGLALVDEALAALDSSNERQYEPKLHQIKGDLLLLQDLAGDELAATRAEAEACFRRAIEIAQTQGAKLWEARALASLCRLLESQGRDEGCRQQLADLYTWFTEGFETEDLQVVRAVLQATT